MANSYVWLVRLDSIDALCILCFDTIFGQLTAIVSLANCEYKRISSVNSHQEYSHYCLIGTGVKFILCSKRPNLLLQY